MMQKDLKTLKALSTGDKVKKAESLYAHEIACDTHNPTAEFRIIHEVNFSVVLQVQQENNDVPFNREK